MTTRRQLLQAGAASALVAGFPAIVRAQPDAIKIGHLTPMTGFLGALGVYAVKGIRIAADDSTYAIPAGRLGLGYRYDGIRRLIDLVGPSFAAEIFFTARKFNAQEAVTMGLINRLVPAGELESYTRGYAEMIADNAPLTLAAVKRCVLERHKDPSDRDLKRCQDMVDACFASKDYEEGRTAFMEKRRPVFRGR